MPASARLLLRSALVALGGLAAAAGLASAASSATVTFSRQLQAQPIERVWFVVDATDRSLLGFEGTDEEFSEALDEALTDYFGDEEFYEDDPVDIPDLPSSVPADDYSRLRILQDAGLANGATSYQAAMHDLELPFMFAGLEQWVRNVGGEGVYDEPRLWNVSMQSVMTDEHAARLLVARAMQAVEEEGRTLTADYDYWQSLVPEWAPRVRDQLAAEGIPFSVELFAWPGVNLQNPREPLFDKDEAPLSMFSLGVLQKGERTFLRGLAAEEVQLELWPIVYRYHHRCAGCPVPDGYQAGLTFGSPVLLADGTYLRSPIQESDVYTRWTRWRYPGAYPDEEIEALPTFPDGWFAGRYAEFAPDQLSEDTKARYLLLMQGG